jgi:hypothetical protein
VLCTSELRLGGRRTLCGSVRIRSQPHIQGSVGRALIGQFLLAYMVRGDLTRRSVCGRSTPLNSEGASTSNETGD